MLQLKLNYSILSVIETAKIAMKPKVQLNKTLPSMITDNKSAIK